MKTEITLITLITMAIIAVFSIAYSLTPEPAKSHSYEWTYKFGPGSFIQRNRS